MADLLTRTNLGLLRKNEGDFNISQWGNHPKIKRSIKVDGAEDLLQISRGGVPPPNWPFVWLDSGVLSSRGKVMVIATLACVTEAGTAGKYFGPAVHILGGQPDADQDGVASASSIGRATTERQTLREVEDGESTGIPPGALRDTDDNPRSYDTDYLQGIFADGTSIVSYDFTDDALLSMTSTRSSGLVGFNWHNDDQVSYCRRFYAMEDRYLAVSGLPLGYKAKVRDSGGSVLEEATEAGGTASVDMLKVDPAEAHDLIVTDSGDVTVSTTVPGDGLWGGDAYTFSDSAGQIFWAEMEVPIGPDRKGQMYWAEMGVPNVPTMVEPVIAVLDNIPAAGGGSLARVPNYVKATITRDRRGRHELTLAGPRNASWASGLVRGQAIHTRLHNSEVFDWRISAVKDGVGPRREPLTLVVGDPIEVDLMDCGPIRTVESGGITSYVVTWEAQTATQIITDIILPALVDYGMDFISIGTVDPTALLTGLAEMVTPGELLAILENATGTYFRLRPDGLTGYFLDLVADLSDGAPVARVRTGVNLVQLARSRSGEDIATVIIVRGSDSGGLRVPVGMATWEVSAVTAAGTDFWVTLIDPDGGAGPVAIDEQFAGNGLPASNPKRIPTHYLRLIDGSLREILDTNAPGDFLVGTDTGISVGDLLYISPDNAGTLLTEIHSPTGLGLYGRVARYYEMDDIAGRDNLSQNPLGDDWAAEPFLMAGVIDGTTFTTAWDLKDCIPGYVIKAGMLVVIYTAGFNQPFVISVVTGDTVDHYGAASIVVSFPFGPLRDEQVAVFFPQDTDALPDDWTDVGNVGAIVAKRPADQDEDDLSATLSWVANYYMGGQLSGLTEGDRIYAGDKILLGGTIEGIVVSDAIADAAGECIIQWNRYLGAVVAPLAVVISRTVPPIQDGQTSSVTFPPYPTQNLGIFQTKLQGPSASVRLIEGATTLWASCGFYLRNPFDSAVTVEAGGEITPPGVALWDGVNEVSTKTADPFIVEAESDATIILRTPYEMSAAGTFNVRALGLMADASFGSAVNFAFAPATTLLWLELQLNNEEPEGITIISGASARVLHQAANVTLLETHLWPTAIEVTSRELVEFWGLTPPESKLTLGQTVRVTESTLGLDLELLVDRIRWQMDNPENPQYVLGVAEQDLSERLIGALAEGGAVGTTTVVGSGSSGGTPVPGYSDAEIDQLLLDGFGLPFRDAALTDELIATRTIPLVRQGVANALPTLGDRVIFLRADAVTYENIVFKIMD